MKIRRLSQPLKQVEGENMNQTLNPILKNNFQLDNNYDQNKNTYDKTQNIASNQLLYIIIILQTYNIIIYFI